MFHKIIEAFSEIITNVNVLDFREYGGARSLVAKLTFSDSSELHIRDYIFLDGQRKYSYHWQNRRGNLIIRWDNSPHHLQIKGFPHHKHLPDQIIISAERDLQSIIKLISDKIMLKPT